MSDMSNYLETALLNAVLRGTNFTAPAVVDLHLALFTADPTDANTTANEVTAGWYSRKPTGTWTAPSDTGTGPTQSTNSAAITFDAVTGAQITITHIGIYDAASGGNLLLHKALTSPKTLQIGDVISFTIGAIQARLD